jgi:four helix bundle protein
MKITRFEDLKCWQEARILVNMVYQAVKNDPGFQKDFRLSGQVTGAAVSSMSNIAEGFSRRSNREFVQFLFVSKSSATEVQSESYVALDQGYISKETFEKIYHQAEKVSKINSGFITYLLQHEQESRKLKKPAKHYKLPNPNKLSEPNELDKLHKPSKPDKLSKPKEPKEPGKPNKLKKPDQLNKLDKLE